ncbi:unnamed protein product [Danaus chrysippus]|uniref:(African queen) hypothetical protein n=1 Tax=Danaus chrysippus TaxID=151541 RepID=A0A8J2Q5Q2_9NEOP|nr:unnamed protein product [Danaus chrysippus]
MVQCLQLTPLSEHYLGIRSSSCNRAFADICMRFSIFKPIKSCYTIMVSKPLLLEHNLECTILDIYTNVQDRRSFQASVCVDAIRAHHASMHLDPNLLALGLPISCHGLRKTDSLPIIRYENVLIARRFTLDNAKLD